MESPQYDAKIDIYGVDHRSEQHARAVSAAVQDESPDYVLREALGRATYEDVKDDVVLDGRIATPQRLAAYIDEETGTELDLSYLDDTARNTLLVDLSPDTLKQVYGQVSEQDGTGDAADRIDTYLERMDSPNSTETYRVNAAVYDQQQSGSDTRVAGMDVQTDTSSVLPTRMEQRNRTMVDQHVEKLEDGHTHLLSVMGQDHVPDVAQLLELEGYDVSVTYPDTEEVSHSSEEYSDWITSQL